jgi:serine-type D-Ala-D-Ala carboxypeptidase (penicillin-binding protein 5/6)
LSSRLARRTARRAAVLGAAGAAVLALLLLAPSVSAARPSPAPPTVPARAWILIDAGDGARLAAQDPAGSRAMASATKLMTAYLALHRLDPDRRLVAPRYHASPGESLLGLRPGERISVGDLLYGLLLASGNDAAVALADGVAGSVPAFVGEMNVAARRLGLDDTSYANPIGLDAPGNYSSPRDLAKLSLRLRRVPLFRRIVDTPRITLHSGADQRTVVNRNDLVGRVRWINGVKTGDTLDAGHVLVASGTRKGVTLISVLMGAPSIAARDEGTLALLRYGFSLYRLETPVREGERLAFPPVPNAGERLPVIAARSLRAAVRRGERVDVSVRVPDHLEAPIRRGERVGRVDLTVGGEPVGRVLLLAHRSLAAASGESLVARLDDVVPGGRVALWGGAVGAAILIGIALAVARSRVTARRRDGGTL